MKNSTCVLARLMIVLTLTVIQSLAQSAYTPYTFTTLAGNVGYGSADGTGSAARFYYPQGVTVDNAGNIYVADSNNHTIRKVTPAGAVTLLAGLAGSRGSADGTGSAARFYGPYGVAVDGAGNVYVADSNNNTIRKVTPTGVVTTLAGLAPFVGSFDGTGSIAFFHSPAGVAVDSAGNVYVADRDNHTIRKVTPAGVVTTLAGLAQCCDVNGNLVSGSADGTGSAARFSSPSGVAVDNAGNVYVADRDNYTIRKVTPAGVVTTLAGLAGNPGSTDGIGSAARFYYPYGVTVDNVGNIYVADTGNSIIRKVTQAGEVTTLAGLARCCDVNGNPLGGSADGTGSDARFRNPFGVAVDIAGNVYVADTPNHTIRRVTTAGVVTTLAGLAGGQGSADGTGGAAFFFHPSGVAVDNAGNLYVADTYNNTIRKMTPAGVVMTLAGLAQLDANGEPVHGSADGTGSEARFFGPTGVAVDSAGNVYVADSANNTIRKVTLAGVVTTLAGLADPFHSGSADGTGAAAGFSYPSGVAVDTAGNVYVADTDNHTIRKAEPLGAVTTLAGLAGSSGSADGIGSAARFARPSSVAVDSAGNVYIGDYDNSTIRRVTPSGVVTTLAGGAHIEGSADGTGSTASFFHPSGVAVDNAGNVYVVDTYNSTIRKMTPAGVVTTLAGLAQLDGIYSVVGSADGTGSAARFNFPFGVAADSAGNIYVADSYNNTIRKGSAAPMGFLLFGPRIGFKGGPFGLFLTGPEGRSAVVEASTDLMSWLPVWTNTFAGALNFVDPQSGIYSNRFYRAFMP